VPQSREQPAGESSFAVHFDGTTWSLVPMPAGLKVWSVTSVSAADAWAVGQLDPATVQATIQPAMVHRTSGRVGPAGHHAHWAVGTQAPVAPGAPLILERH
jgi:hypothetical protein